MKYDPTCVNGIEPSTHTACARLNPPQVLDIQKVFDWFQTEEGLKVFDGRYDRYPYLFVQSASIGNKKVECGNKITKLPTWFRNCAVLSIRTKGEGIKERGVSVKMFLNGSFQYTGCQNQAHMMDVLMMTWDILVRSGAAPVGSVTFKCSVSMVNFKFQLGMMVDRSSLDFYISQFPHIASSYDTMIDTATNVKMIKDEPEFSDIMVLEYNPGYVKGNKGLELDPDQYMHSIEMAKEPNARFGEKVKHTFRVFHKGTVIQSGRNLQQIIDTYTRFTKIVQMLRPKIEFIEDVKLRKEVAEWIKLTKKMKKLKKVEINE